jgi:hypothetical protein
MSEEKTIDVRMVFDYYSINLKYKSDEGKSKRPESR